MISTPHNITFCPTDAVMTSGVASGVAGVYQDVDLVCSDGTISYPKLVAGLVFPSLASCQVLQFPTQHTLLLPDYTSADLITTVHSVLGTECPNTSRLTSLTFHVAGLDFDSFLHQNLDDLSGSETGWEDLADISDYLHVEAREDEPESEDDVETSDGSLVCKICYATFKTRSGWRNHKVIHQKFRTKEYACYICYRRFYWDKDCRRHVKNIHGLDFYDSEGSRQAANVESEKSNMKVELEQSYGTLSKSNLMKMKIQMIKCKKSQLDNSRPKEVAQEENSLKVKTKTGHCEPPENLSKPNLDLNINNNDISQADISSPNIYSLRSEEIETPSDNKLRKLKSTKKNHKDLCHSCRDCAKKFSNLKSLKAHERTCKAPADSPYICSFCERIFIDFEKLQKHWKVNHNRQQMI